jgi:peptidyl-prolyl cis-trans isomerase B (cyclophilin B)
VNVVVRRAFAPFFAAAAVAATTVNPAAAAPAKPSPIVTIVTERGTIRVKLFPQDAPNTVANFVKLANRRFYDGLTFHRVEQDFVIQGGDPLSRKLPVGDPQIGTGGPGYMIKNETNRVLKHNVGAVAMANSGRDTAGSQFYIVIGRPAPHLDNGSYTIFGQVIQGQDVAEKIRPGDKMRRVTVSHPRPAKK